MTEYPLSVTVECTGNPKCIFSDEDLPITIKIKNESDNEVHLAREFVNRVGPFIRLRDKLTQKERQIRVNRASLDLLNVYKAIPSLGTVGIEASISRSDILSFRKEFIDIEAEIVISTNIQHSNNVEKFRGISTIRIIGTDTAGLGQGQRD